MDPKWLRIGVVVVIIVVVIGVIGAYWVLTRPVECRVQSKNPLIYDQPEQPDSIDPHVTFSTPGWGAVLQVYQTLVQYNGSSYTTFLPVLAKNWSVSTDHMHWNFTLRQGVHFSNGDPFTAYTMWFSLNRALLMTQDPQFILSQNFWYPDLDGVNYPEGAPETMMAEANMTTWLNTWDFRAPTAPQIATMGAANQSFRVLDANTIQLNVGYGYLGPVAYNYLLPTIASPIAAAVDPIVIQANGGVSNTTTNTWMSENMLGTGPYVLQGTYTPSATFYTQVPDPNYWGITAAAAEPWNNIIQPAKSSVKIQFQGQPALNVQDLRSGAVAAASFAYIGPSTIGQLQTTPCVVVNPLPIVYGATAGSWFIYMNQNTEPFNNLSVRAAVVHAIDYQRIITQAFGGYASRWVGPVPPSYDYYNPESLAPYAYNVALAQQFMANSPWPSGYPNALNYEYIDLGDWAGVGSILRANLAVIGININPVPISLERLYEIQQVDPSTGQCTAQMPVGGGPFPIGQEFYTSDYIAPDDWTQNIAISWGSANMCMAGYNNATMDTLVLAAAGESDPGTLTSYYSQMTRMMYDNYTVAWLVVPTTFQVYNSLLKGIIPNPMGTAHPLVMMFNTEYVD